MKTTIFALLFMAVMITGSLATAMHGKTVLLFEAPDCRTFEMKMSEEIKPVDDIPAFILPKVSAGASDPENHIFFQALIMEIQKPEIEDTLPPEIR